MASASNTSQIIAWIVIAALLIAIVIQQILVVMKSVHEEFAREQVGIFHEMIEQARANPSDAHGCLEYVRNYYPSGTKQVEGSKLDQIVEGCRSHAIAEIERLLIQDD